MSSVREISDKQVETSHGGALISRNADFWMIGGASIAVWLILFAVDLHRGYNSVSRHIANLAPLSITMMLVINYPHFMASYRIAYGRGLSFIFKHWLQLILVPLAMIATFALALLTYNDPSTLPAAWNPLGLRYGEGLASLAVAFMFLTVGWHYSKQAYGCMMVYAKLEGYRLTPFQRSITRYALHSIWLVNFVHAQVGYGVTVGEPYYGVPNFAVNLPPLLLVAVQMILVCLMAWFAYAVLLRNWRERGQKPPLLFVTPIIALAIWWLPVFYQYEFYMWLVPGFHSLQYLPFAYRHESSRLKAQGAKPWAGTREVFVLIVVGFLGFELVPEIADQRLKPELVQVAFFMAAFNVFINVHHYFIDNVIWRFDQPEVRRYLFDLDEPAPSAITKSIVEAGTVPVASGT